MRYLMRFLPLIVALGLIGFAPARAADGGDGGKDRVNQLIIYGDDPCPQSSKDEITVCARKDEGERYRIPPGLRDSTSPENVAWTNRVKSYETVGATGNQSCSAVGPGGWQGCAGKLISQAYAEKKEGTDVHFRELIAAARAKREAVTDAEAAETQSRVEEAERAYEARQRKAQDATSPSAAPALAPAVAPAPAPVPVTSLTKPPADDGDIAAPLPATTK